MDAGLGKLLLVHSDSGKKALVGGSFGDGWDIAVCLNLDIRWVNFYFEFVLQNDHLLLPSLIVQSMIGKTSNNWVSEWKVLFRLIYLHYTSDSGCK